MHKIQIIFFLSIIFFLCHLKILGQVEQGEIIYGVNINKMLEKEKKLSSKSKNARTSFVDAGKEMEKITLSLVFNDNYGLFQRKKTLATDNSEFAFKVALILSNKGTFYTNLKEKKQLQQREFEGEIFNVDLPFENNKWVLSKESKIIKGFKCYKATMSVEGSTGISQKIAWYTKEIPVSLGPANFVGNLPGIVLELEDATLSYTCISVVLNPKKDIVIKWPKNEDTISKEEYKRTGDQLKDKLKRNSKNR